MRRDHFWSWTCRVARVCCRAKKGGKEWKEGKRNAEDGDGEAFLLGLIIESWKTVEAV